MMETPFPPRAASMNTLLDPEPPRIILADDDDDMRQLVASVLRADGYFVLEARDGAKLQKLAHTLLYSGLADPRPELVISDIRMPGLSGLDVVSWLRELDWMTPVILLTGFGDAETHRKARELGVAAVFDKPFDLSVLRRRVRDIVPHG